MPMTSEQASNVTYLTQAQLQKPSLWSYILRDPAGNVVILGQGHTRNACQRQAMLHASDHAEKLSILHAIVRCSPNDQGWRFVVAPPSSQPQAKQRPKPFRPSKPQIEVLMLGLAHKLSRYWMGWCYDDRTQPGDPVRMFSTATINALWNRGLLAANCLDPRLECRELSKTQKPDGASQFQVWTSDLGIKTLENEGMLVLRDG
jgi:hypothetical protein